MTHVLNCFLFHTDAYSAWVQQRLKVGSRVRISHDIHEGEKGRTGVVLEIDVNDIVTDSNVMVYNFLCYIWQTNL